MDSLRPWGILLLVMLGNCGFWLFCFNRVSSTSLPRPISKRIEKLLILVCFAIPTAVAFAQWPALHAWLMGGYRPGWWPADAAVFDLWAGGSLLALAALGPGWLISRLWLIPPRHFLRNSVNRFSADQFLSRPAAIDGQTRWLERLPGNEITQLEVNEKDLKLPRPIPGTDGLRIGHLSDIHLTGQLSQEFYHFVFERFMELAPDLIIISGDIIDTADCLPWIDPLFSRLSAPLGCAYLLGNHDRRLKSIDPLVARLNGLGLHDLGVSDLRCCLASGTKLCLYGNERPWFERHAVVPNRGQPAGETGDASDQMTLRIGVSHSPDQIGWARRRQLDLLLAGHTHGGQARFPLIGPIVAPSRYGSRFASGVFFLPPTLMHVSRGVAGTHPLRWRCPPEVSVLRLVAN